MPGGRPHPAGRCRGLLPPAGGLRGVSPHLLPPPVCSKSPKALRTPVGILTETAFGV